MPETRQCPKHDVKLLIITFDITFLGGFTMEKITAQKVVSHFFGAKTGELSDADLAVFKESCVTTGNLNTVRAINHEIARRKQQKRAERAVEIDELLDDIVSGKQYTADDIIQSQRLITSQHIAARIIKDEILPRSGKGASCTALNVDRFGRVTRTIHLCDYGLMVRELEKTGSLCTAKVPEDGGGVRRVKRYTYHLVMFTVDDAAGLGFIATRPVKDDKGNIVQKAGICSLYRTLEGGEKFWINIRVKGQPVMVDINSDETRKERTSDGRFVFRSYQDVMPLEEWKAKYQKKGFWFYNGAWASSSPGELKSHTLRMPGIWIGPEQTEFSWDVFYDTATSGAWPAFNERGGTDKYNETAEFNARCTLSNAYATYVDYPLRSYGFFAGKFKTPAEAGLAIDGGAYEAMDGLTLVNNEYLARAFSSALENTTFEPESVTGLLLQCRFFNVNKNTALSVNKEQMEVFIDKIGADIVHLSVYDLTESQKAAMSLLMANKSKPDAFCEVNGEQVNLKGKLIVLHWDEESFLNKAMPEYLTDANGQKAEFDPTRFESGPRILSMAHEDNKRAVLSTQILGSYAACNWEKTTQMVDVLSSMEIDKAEQKLLSKEGQYLSWMDLQRHTEINLDTETGEETRDVYTPNYADLVKKTAPAYAQKYSHGAWKRLVNQTVESLSKMFNKLNIPIDGTHTILVPDLAVVFADKPVLGMRADGVTELYSKTEMATTITAEEYKQKIVDAGIIGKAKEAIFAAIDNLSPGITVVPADEWTARANEGWDYDGDSMYTFKVDKGYKAVTDDNGFKHHVWCSDDEAEDRIIVAHVNRYPKGHPFGYMKTLPQSWLEDPYCVIIEG